MCLPDLLNCVDPKEMEGSWERQMGGGANQQATPNLCLQGVTQMGMCSGPKVRFCYGSIVAFILYIHILLLNWMMLLSACIQ